MRLYNIWIPETVTCQKLEAKLSRYAFAKHEIAYWKHVSHWSRKEVKNEKPEILIDSDQLAWCLLDIFEKCTENEYYQISKITVFTIFPLQKHEIYHKF